MDTFISLTLLAVVLTPLYLVVRDLWTMRSRRNGSVLSLPRSPGAFGSISTFPSLSLLEDMEDTMPACLRRTHWDGPDV